jgi:hypothetical protein
MTSEVAPITMHNAEILTQGPPLTKSAYQLINVIRPVRITIFFGRKKAGARSGHSAQKNLE